MVYTCKIYFSQQNGLPNSQDMQTIRHSLQCPSLSSWEKKNCEFKYKFSRVFLYNQYEGKTCMKSIQHSDGFYNDEKLAKIKIQVLVK